MKTNQSKLTRHNTQRSTTVTRFSSRTVACDVQTLSLEVKILLVVLEDSRSRASMPTVVEWETVSSVR